MIPPGIGHLNGWKRICAETLEMKGKDLELIEGSLEKGFEAFIQRAIRNRNRMLGKGA